MAGVGKLRVELERLANAGAPISELDDQLERAELDEDLYDELWLYAWALVMTQSQRLHLNGLNGLYQDAPLDA